MGKAQWKEATYTNGKPLGKLIATPERDDGGLGWGGAENNVTGLDTERNKGVQNKQLTFWAEQLEVNGMEKSH